MRQIGTIADETSARRLADHLLTLDISTRLDSSPDGWVVWVHREDRLDQARQEMDAFFQRPNDPKYEEASVAARKRRKEAERIEREHRRNTRDVRELWSGPNIRRCPLTFALIGISVALALLSNFGKNRAIVDPLLFASYEIGMITEDVARGNGGTIVGNVAIFSDPWRDIARGQIWRPITPIFLHGSLLHIAFNMYWIYLLGGAIEFRRKTPTLAALVIIGALTSNLGQYLYSGHPNFFGMSGVVLTLFGYVWMKGLYEPESGLGLSQTVVLFMIIYVGYTTLYGLPGVSIAVAAHLVGLVVGVLIGLGPHLFGGPRHE